MRDPKLISIGPYLEILAHRFLPDRSGKSRSHPGALPIPRDVGGGGGAPLPSFSPQASGGGDDGEVVFTLGRDAFNNNKKKREKGKMHAAQECLANKDALRVSDRSMRLNNVSEKKSKAHRGNDQVGLIGKLLPKLLFLILWDWDNYIITD